MTLNDKVLESVLTFQQNELSEHFIYAELSRLERNENNRKVLKDISEDELRHYGILRNHSGKEVKPDSLKVWRYVLLARIFGVTFAVKLMESGEKGAQASYEKLSGAVPEVIRIRREEEEHEKKLIAMIDEEKLKYIGSVVLGLNDALVELTGTLAGLTFALQDAKLVGIAGLITGIAASLSMGASEYLSTKAEGGEKNPLKASVYTWITYVLAVAILIFPFLLLRSPFVSLLFALMGAVLLICVFTFYFSVVREVPFRRRLAEMLTISLGVTFLSFIIGLLVRQFLGVEI